MKAFSLLLPCLLSLSGSVSAANQALTDLTNAHTAQSSVIFPASSILANWEFIKTDDGSLEVSTYHMYSCLHESFKTQRYHLTCNSTEGYPYTTCG
jgi:hypothetical protein